MPNRRERLAAALLVAPLLLFLLGVFLLGLIINALAPSFGSVPSKIQAMKVARAASRSSCPP